MFVGFAMDRPLPLATPMRQHNKSQTQNPIGPPVGMVKQPTSEQSEFTMSSEDFPALPGTSVGGHAPPAPADYAHAPDKPSRKGIQTSPDGKTLLLFFFLNIS